MRGRPIVYDLEQIRSFDFLSGFKDFMKSEGDLAEFLFGPTDTILSGFSAAAMPVPSMYIQLAAGRILQWAPSDTADYGAVPSDSESIYQLGYYPAQTLQLTKGQLAAGQSQWVLIRGRFIQTDAIRDNDPDGGIPPFFNSANPLNPLQGQNGNGQNMPTVRQGLVEISTLYGTPATTGSEVPPSAGGGYVPLYLIDLTFGATPVGNGDILVAGDNAYPGYTPAPFWKGVRAQHHKGIEFGQAPKIDVTQEITGIVPMANLPATSLYGLLPTLRQCTGNPNGQLAGGVGDIAFQTDAGVFWNCVTLGDATHAVWTPGGPIGVTVINAFPATITASGGINALQIGAADGTVNLNPASTNRILEFVRNDNSDFNALLTCANSDKIYKDGQQYSSVALLPGQSCRLASIPNNATPTQSTWLWM